MKIGLIARADNTGLGTQTWEFFKNIRPDKTLVVNSESCNGNKQFLYRFSGQGTKQARTIWGRVDVKKESIVEFAKGLDVVFTCETPYNYYLFEYCMRRGIKSILQYNFEFLDYLNNQRYMRPTILAAPSTWHFQECQQRFGARYLPVPVNRAVLPFQRKTKFKNFLHLAGIRVDHDRNGTEETLKAFAELPHLNLTVKVQNEGWAENWRKQFNFNNITIIGNNAENYYDNYTGFDAFIFPRKYGGLCLPMQEALSCGMPVIMTATSPNTDMLPDEWLVSCSKVSQFESRGYVLDIHAADVQGLKTKIEWLGSLNEAEAGTESDKANAIASTLDWNAWKEKYLEFFRS